MHAYSQDFYNFKRFEYKQNWSEYRPELNVHNGRVYSFYHSVDSIIGGSWVGIISELDANGYDPLVSKLLNVDTNKVSTAGYNTSFIDTFSNRVVYCYATYHDSTNSNRDGTVVSYDLATLQPEFFFTTDISGGDRLFQGRLCPDGNYIFTGSNRSEGALVSNLLVIKLSPEGELIWKKIFQNSGDEAGGAIEVAPDGGYYVHFVSDLYGQHPLVYFESGLLKIDDDGNEEWRTTWGGEFSDAAWDIDVDEDVGILCSGLVGDGYLNDQNFAYARMMDFDGNLIWDFKLNPFDAWKESVAEVFNRGIILENGNILLLGQGYYGTHDSTILGQRVPWLYLLDSNGELLMNRAYHSAFPGRSWGIPSDIDILDDGSMLLSGTYFPLYEDTSSQDVFILKLDEHYCEYPNCQPPLATEDVLGEKHGLRVYPNPASSRLNIVINGEVELSTHLTLVNMLGELILRDQVQQKEIQLDISDLREGSYILIVKSKTAITRKRIIVTR